MRYLFVLARCFHMIIWNQVNLSVGVQAHDIKHFVLSVGLGLLELRKTERFYWKHLSVKYLLLKLFIERYGSFNEPSLAQFCVVIHKERCENQMTATLNISPQTSCFIFCQSKCFLFQISMCKCCIYISACFPFVHSLMHVYSLKSMITVVIECYRLTWIFKY